MCFQKIYGLDALDHQLVEKSWDVTPVQRQTGRQRVEGRAVFCFSSFRNSSFYMFFLFYFWVSVSLSSSHESFQFVLNTFYFSSSWEVHGPSGKDNPAVIKTLQQFKKNILRRKHFLLTFLNLWAKLFGRAAATYTVSGVHKQNPRRQKLIFPPIVLGVSQERDLFQVITISKETTLTRPLSQPPWSTGGAGQAQVVRWAPTGGLVLVSNL